MSEKIIHSFEAGRRGKPDELDTAIANLIGAEFLWISQDARFDIRVSGGYSLSESGPKIRVSGEVSDFVLRTPNIKSRLTEMVTAYYNNIHRTSLGPKDIIFSYEFKPQASTLASNGHAGDSGNPIAVAYKWGPNYLPYERYLAVEIRDLLDNLLPKLSGRKLKADGKVSVDAVYEGVNLVGITKVILAVEHEPAYGIDDLRLDIGKLLRPVLDKYRGNPTIVINGLGSWHTGGWNVDEGSREAKPYRDGFASYGCCEDSFSGEDPSKPSGTGTFLARHIAVTIVAAGLADFARVALTYTIGREEVGLNVTTQNTAKISQEELHKLVRDKFGLRIKDSIESFGLKNPELYRRFAENSDYFQDSSYPWNKPCRDSLL